MAEATSFYGKKSTSANNKRGQPMYSSRKQHGSTKHSIMLCEVVSADPQPRYLMCFQEKVCFSTLTESLLEINPKEGRNWFTKTLNTKGLSIYR